jgi:ADP-ribosylglycohydrolase
MRDPLDPYLGCLLGGAVGDALGAPVEFLTLAQIQRQFGDAGVRDFAPAYGRTGAITDDTQMSLFTAEGLLRAQMRLLDRGFCALPAVVSGAYLRWLLTQGQFERAAETTRDGWLIELPELHHRRAPGTTCLSALIETPWGEPARNNSKGCGGVMRVAPVGLFLASLRAGDSGLEEAFDMACELAALTHGHSSGQLSAGVLAATVLRLLRCDELTSAVAKAIEVLKQRPAHSETLAAVEAALGLAASEPEAEISRLGEGWVAEEALAMGLFAALTAADFEHGVLRAVNHGGDSDSTGSIAGNLLGARWGASAIPTRWRERVELAEAITGMAQDLHDCGRWQLRAGGDESPLSARAFDRYPPN